MNKKVKKSTESSIFRFKKNCDNNIILYNKKEAEQKVWYIKKYLKFIYYKMKENKGVILVSK